jgi:hypothetical protein
MHGDAGNDTLYGGDGIDTVFGGDGNDSGLFNALYIRGPRVSPRCNSCAKHASRPDRRIPARQDL